MLESGVLMLRLPPYHAEINPCNVIFNTIVSRMKSTLARCGMCNLDKFKSEIMCELSSFTHEYVKKMYIICGYTKEYKRIDNN